MLAEREVLDLPIPQGGQNDLRREQLMRYIRETYVTRYDFSSLPEEISLGDGD